MKGNFEKGPFSAAEKCGLRCADKIHRSPHEIDDEFYAELKKHYNDQQIIEITCVAAAFDFFPRFVDALHIPTTPVPDGLLETKK